MTTRAAELPELLIIDSSAWREWLGKHHSDSQGVRLVLSKKGALEPTRLTYAQALEEALSYGWIDGQGNLHSPPQAQRVVEAQHPDRRAADRGKTHARGRTRRD